MQVELTSLLAPLGGEVACLVISMEQDGPRTLCTFNPDHIFPAASLAKVPILVTLAYCLEDAAFPYSWGTPLSVPASACVPSDGLLADLSRNWQPTIQDLAYLMITISDNSAANVLLDLIGMERINATVLKLGLQHTRLERHFMDFEARQAGRDNWTTAADMALLFSALPGDRVPSAARILQILQRQHDNALLSAYWEEDGLFAHKTGGLPGVVHDAGLLFYAPADLEPLIIVALTAEQEDVPLTALTLARAGRVLRQLWRS
jgi:beta-lactamase class A